MKRHVASLLAQALDALREAGELPAEAELPEIQVERARDRAYGDYAANTAMVLAKAARRKPRELAEAIRDRLPAGVDRVQAFGGIHRAFWFYDRDELIIPMARYERRGCLASPYLLVWTQHQLRIRDHFPDARLVNRLPYHDLLLFRARSSGPLCPEAQEASEAAAIPTVARETGEPA